MEGKAKGDGTIKITMVDNEGNKVELVSKLDIESAMAVGNEKLGHQTEGGSQLLRPEFIQGLENHGEGPEINSVLTETFKFPENTTAATTNFLNACKNNLKIATVKRNDHISTTYHDTMKLWGMLKEKHARMAIIWATTNMQCNTIG